MDSFFRKGKTGLKRYFKPVFIIQLISRIEQWV